MECDFTWGCLRDHGVIKTLAKVGDFRTHSKQKWIQKIRQTFNVPGMFLAVLAHAALHNVPAALERTSQRTHSPLCRLPYRARPTGPARALLTWAADYCVLRTQVLLLHRLFSVLMKHVELNYTEQRLASFTDSSSVGSDQISPSLDWIVLK